MTNRYRQVKKYGNSYVITLFQSDMIDLKLTEGDIVDIEDIVIVNKSQPNGNKTHLSGVRKLGSNKLKGKPLNKKGSTKLKRGVRI